jgi:hypothetical protein
MAVAFTLGDLGDLAATEEDYPRARTLHEEALAILQTLGDPASVGHSILCLGLIACHEGDHPTARRHLEHCQSLFDVGQDKDGMAPTLHALGVVALREGAIDEASTRFAASLSLSEEIDDALGIVQCLEGSAEVACNWGRFDAAARLLGAAATGRRRLGAPHSVRDEAHLRRVVALAQTGLGEELFQTTSAAGESLNLTEAVSLARSEVMGNEPVRPIVDD